MQYDIWSNDDGGITATPAEIPVVTDGDAPYGYDKHEWRVGAESKRQAMKLYRQELKQT